MLFLFVCFGFLYILTIFFVKKAFHIRGSGSCGGAVLLWTQNVDNSGPQGEQWQTVWAHSKHRAVFAHIPVPFLSLSLVCSSLYPRLLTDYRFIRKYFSTWFYFCAVNFFPDLLKGALDLLYLFVPVCLTMCSFCHYGNYFTGNGSQSLSGCLKHYKEQNLSPSWVLRHWVGWGAGSLV